MKDVTSNIRTSSRGKNINFTAGIALAVGLLYPFFGVVQSPIIVAAAMALSLSVVTNANRLGHARITRTSKGSNT